MDMFFMFCTRVQLSGDGGCVGDSFYAAYNDKVAPTSPQSAYRLPENADGTAS